MLPQGKYVLSISYVFIIFLIAAIKRLRRSNLRKEGVIPGSQFEGTVRCDGKFIETGM